MWQQAANVFAFDALIQNPDRRTDNPNLFTQGDDVYVYDHETSFSFLLAVGSSSEPWNLEREDYLARHVFYTRLRSKQISLDHFRQRLEELTETFFLNIREETPAAWMHSDLERIEAHLVEARDHADQFTEQVRRRLVW